MEMVEAVTAAKGRVRGLAAGKRRILIRPCALIISGAAGLIRFSVPWQYLTEKGALDIRLFRRCRIISVLWQNAGFRKNKK